MVVSSDSSSPLVVVVGATGVQGGSVIRNLIESDKPYRLRGLTRDSSKPAAQKVKELGVEVVSVTIGPGNEAAVREAFKGADIVFAMTNFWESADPAREIADGKLMVDAAKAVGAKLFVWSGLEDVAKGSGGKYTHVYHFDGKAQIAAYAQSQLPTVDVQAGFYMTNFADAQVALRKLDDGSYVWEHPASLSPVRVPYIDMVHDYGLFVRYAIESLEYRAGGKVIHSYGELITNAEAVAAIERARGTNISIKPRPIEEYVGQLKAIGAPELVLKDMADMSGFMIDFGYYFDKESTPEQQKIRKELARRPRTFEEFLKANPDFLKA